MSRIKNKFLVRKIISSSASVVISLSLVLFVVGILALVLINSQRIIKEYKEEFVYTIMLEDNISEMETIRFQKELEAAKFTKNLIFITKEEAAQKLKTEIGEDFEEFLGYIPLPSSIDIKLNANYANSDSLEKISNELNKSPFVFETYYQKDRVNFFNILLRCLCNYKINGSFSIYIRLYWDIRKFYSYFCNIFYF